MRLRRVAEELAGAVRIEWRSFLLRPEPDPRATLEQFRAYTRSWLRPAADPDGGTFRVWATDAGPPEAVWREAGLPPEAFVRAADPTLLRTTVAEHNDALERGITGVPAVMLEGNDAFILGAQPLETYRRWLARALGR